MEMKYYTMLILIFFSSIVTITNAQAPEPRWISNMVYDDANQQVLIFGGGTSKAIATDLWALKKSKWVKLSDAGPKLLKCTTVYDPSRKRLVLVGGYGDDEVLTSDTWEWDGKHWSKMDVAGPPARNHAMGIYDEKNKHILLFGGFGKSGALSDTWSYDGKEWKLLKNDSPTGYLPHGMIYDEVRDKPVLIGVSLNNESSEHKVNKMWEWTGNDWIEISNGKLLTSPQSIQAMASFGNENIVLLDGDDIENNNAKTWIYSPKGWSAVSLPGPSPRVGHGMVYDKSRNRTILFGGGDRKVLFNDVWEWDGKKWSEISVKH